MIKTSTELEMATKKGGRITIAPQCEFKTHLVITKDTYIDGNGVILWSQDKPVILVNPGVKLTLVNIFVERSANSKNIYSSSDDDAIAIALSQNAELIVKDVVCRGIIKGPATYDKISLPCFLAIGAVDITRENKFKLTMDIPKVAIVKSLSSAFSISKDKVGNEFTLVINKSRANVIIQANICINIGEIQHYIPVVAYGASSFDVPAPGNGEFIFKSNLMSDVKIESAKQVEKKEAPVMMTVAKNKTDTHVEKKTAKVGLNMDAWGGASKDKSKKEEITPNLGALDNLSKNKSSDYLSQSLFSTQIKKKKQ